MKAVYDIIGLVGSFIIASALVPQVSKVYRTKRADDISYPFLCLFATGLAGFTTYGVGEGLWPIFIPSSLELLGVLTLLVLKFQYTPNKANR